MQSPLTPAQIHLVQSTWAEVVPIAYGFSSLFYERLFALDPSARALFTGRNMAEQGAKLIRMLSVIVRELPNLDSIRPEIQELAGRHIEYGVRPDQYQVMKAALLWTLERALGRDFTSSARSAWDVAYEQWAILMLESMARVRGTDPAPALERPPAPDASA